MPERDYQDIISGLALALLGLVVLWYSGTQMRIGTLVRMGPGMFPFGIGLLITLLGGLLALTAVFRQGLRGPKVNWRALGFILLGVLIFSQIIRPLGLVPAVIAVVTLSSFANEQIKLMPVVILNIIMCVLAVLIFKIGLGMNIAIISWAF